MASNFDAKMAELKQAQADLEVIHRQLKAAQKNIVDKNDLGAKTGIQELWDEAARLEKHIDYLKGQVGEASGPAGSDSSAFVFTTMVQTEPDPKKPDVVQQPSLPPTEVYNTPQPEQAPAGGGPSWVRIGVAIALGLTLLLGGWVGLNFLGGAQPTMSAAASPSGSPATSPGRPSPVVTATVRVTASPSPAPSPSAPTEVENISDFLADIGASVAVRDQLASITAADGVSDWNEPDPAINPGEVDIVSALTFEANLGSGFLAQFGGCEVDVVCGASASGQPGAKMGEIGEYYVYVSQVRSAPDDAPIKDLGYFEMGVVTFDTTPAGGGSPEAFDFGADNFLTGSNTAYSLRFNPSEGGLTNVLLRLVHGESDQFFHGEDSTAFAVVSGPVVAVFIPEVEWDGATMFRLFSYYGTAGAASVTDTVPDMSDPMTIYNPESTTVIDLP